MVFNSSAQLQLPHSVPSALLVYPQECRTEGRSERRGAERASAVSVAPKSPSCGAVLFICGEYNVFLKFCLVLVGWLVSGT